MCIVIWYMMWSWTPFLWPPQTLKISKISVISIDIHRHSRYLRYLKCLKGQESDVFGCIWISEMSIYIYRHYRYLRYLKCLEGVREWCTWMSIRHSYISHLFIWHMSFHQAFLLSPPLTLKISKISKLSIDISRHLRYLRCPSFCGVRYQWY